VVVSAASELGETLTEVRAMAVEAPRAMLGWAIVVLTVVVGVLMAWRLPMRRTTRSDAQRWGIPTGYYGGGRYTSHSGNRTPHESLAVEAPVASGPTTNNGSKANAPKANGSGAKLPALVSHDLNRSGVITGGRVKRRQLSRAEAAAAARGSGQSVVRKGLVSGVNGAEFHHAQRILPNRRRRHGRPTNGGIRAARRLVGRKG
jgi:hypothetical protein